MADTDNHQIRTVYPSGLVETLVGYDVGTGIQARVQWPYGIAVNRSGVLFVTSASLENKNSESKNLIIRMTPNGDRWLADTIVGTPGESGGRDGLGQNALLDDPRGIIMGHDDSLYVIEFINCTLRQIRPYGADWMVNTIACEASVADNDLGTRYGSDSRFFRPGGLAIDSAGNLFVANSRGHNIRRVDVSGRMSLIAGSKENSVEDGFGSRAGFYEPYGIGIGQDGTIYVADTRNSTIRKGVFKEFASVVDVASEASIGRGNSKSS